MIPFVEFMHRALYHPAQGYYTAGLPKIGAEGDFITAPELTPLFGQTLANQCREILIQLTTPSLLEFGAGTGRLCVDIMQQLAQWSCLPQTYYILEVSGHLKQKQQALIQDCIPELADRVIWLDQLPATPFNGVIIANEVLDAMPVHRFQLSGQSLLESHAQQNELGEWGEIYLPCTNHLLIDYLNQCLPELPSPYISEVNLFIPGWIKACYDCLKQGVVLLIDYGFPRHEYYHPDRNQGTLMCHYQHHAHPNPFIHIGEQDITAHVDFSQVAEAAMAVGFDVRGYTNQASFLLANGLLNYLAEIKDPKRQFQATQAVKLLIQPTEMGELFKVIALGKNHDFPLSGFLLQDKRASL